MDSSAYIGLSRQSGLLKELQSVANNIANMSTGGFRREGMVYAETLVPLRATGGGIAMATARVRFTDEEQGSLTNTGGTFDLAIEGKGFFMVETPDGNRLTRAGSFALNPAGELVTNDGLRVLDSGGAPVFIPADQGEIGIASDGTVSVADRPVARIGLFEVADPQMLTRTDGVLFTPAGEPLPAENSRIRQGFLEGSNIEPVREMARLIEVQRAYELGQKLLDREDERLRAAIRTLGRTG